MIRSFLLLAPLLLLCQQVRVDDSGRVARVSVLILDSFGAPVEGATMTIDRVPQDRSLSRAQVSMVFNLPYGNHRISVEKSGFSTAVRTVEVSRPTEAVVFGLIPSWIENDSVTVVEGELSGSADRPECVWVRLVPLLAQPEAYEARATNRGSFRFEQVKPGAYTAVVAGEHGICSVTPVKVALALNQRLNLPVLN